MEKVKCKRAMHRISNQSKMLTAIELGKKLLKTKKQKGKENPAKIKYLVKYGINAIDKEMQKMLKLAGKSNSVAKRIMRATKYAHKKALKAE